MRLGSQRPRVFSAPKFSTSSGQEAVRLAASFGLFLDDWQAWFLEQSLGERPDGKWAASKVGLVVPRQNGKGSILEARELAGLFLFKEKRLTHSAHEAKTAKDHFDRMESLLRDAGYGDDKIVYRRSTTEVSITAKRTGCKLQFYTRTADGGRGLGGDVVVIDEAYAVTRDQMAALKPTMAARSLTGNPQIWFTSSAGFAHSDVLAGIRKDGEVGKPRLCYADWSASPGSDIYDRNAWAEANPGLNIRITEDFLEDEITDLGEERFGREHMGLWADSAHAVITPDMWERVKDSASEPVDDVVFAVDAEVDGSQASIAVAGPNADGRVHVELAAVGPGLSWAAGRLIEMCERHHPRAVVVDSASTAASLIPALQAAQIEPMVTTSQHMQRACSGFLSAVADLSLAHTGLEPRLTVSVLSGGKRPLGDAWAWRKRSGTGLSPLVAVTLAHYGWAVNSEGEGTVNLW